MSKYNIDILKIRYETSGNTKDKKNPFISKLRRLKFKAKVIQCSITILFS